MRIALRIPGEIVEIMLTDLRRPHAFAYERVGFLFCRQASLSPGKLLLAHKYHPIPDAYYIEDSTVGAKFNASAIREAMQFALSEQLSALHVHLHDHAGSPRMSSVDTREMRTLMPCFVNLCPDKVHGALLLSADAAIATIWGTSLSPEGDAVAKITSVDSKLRFLSRQ